MNAPRWFYAIHALCALVLTAAGTVALLRPPVYLGRYRYSFDGKAILDTQTGALCLLGGQGCFAPRGELIEKP